jgi:hypothetical protein
MNTEATIHYLAPMDERAFYYLHRAPEGEPWRNTRGERHVVMIHDARLLDPKPELEREGFELVAFDGEPESPDDAGAVRRDFYPKIESLVREQTGAVRVLAFDHNIRTSADDTSGRVAVQAPVRLAHNDYTERSGPQRVRDLVPEDAKALLTRRFAVVNVWKPIVRPALASPLAVCDAQTLRPGDFIETDLRYPDRVGEIYSFAFSERHRWLYVPAMRTDETMLLKCYDSDHERSRFTAHTAIDDPHTPPDAAPRESIEVRTLVFFDESPRGGC